MEPRVAICLANDADWELLEFTAQTLDEFGVSWTRLKVAGPLTLPTSIQVVIAASGRRNLALELSPQTSLPILAVPIDDTTGPPLEALTAAASMPAGAAVGVLALGKAGSINAALMAVAILALGDEGLREKLREYRAKQTSDVLQSTLDPI